MVYSSGENNELAYATSPYPDRGFTYRGVIISNSDLGYKGNITPKAPAGTIHGGIECVGGQWYVFYHRCTNNTDFSRQACAEPITILPDGTIPQVEITTQGLGGKPINAKGSFPAAYACNLTTGKKMKLGNRKPQTRPRITEFDGEIYVGDMADGTEVGYKYFDFQNVSALQVTYLGTGKGALEVRADDKLLGSIPVAPSENWTDSEGAIDFPAGVYGLYLRYRGTGKLDLKEIGFEE